jgi:Restriction endonuclease S subunits
MSGATTGKVGVYNGNIPAYQNQRVGNLKFINETYKSESFRNHLIAYLSPEILKIAYGGAQPNISGKAIEEMNVVIPPLAEQHQIAQILDELLAQVDTIKARLDAIPAILKRFRQSVLSAAVSGKLTEEWRGNAELINWKQYSLLELVNKPSYGSSAKSDKEGKIPVLRMGNIQNGKIDWSDLVYSSNDDEIKKYTLEKMMCYLIELIVQSLLVKRRYTKVSKKRYMLDI